MHAASMVWGGYVSSVENAYGAYRPAAAVQANSFSWVVAYKWLCETSTWKRSRGNGDDFTRVEAHDWPMLISPRRARRVAMPDRQRQGALRYNLPGSARARSGQGAERPHPAGAQARIGVGPDAHPAAVGTEPFGTRWALGDPGRALEAARGLRLGMFPTAERRGRYATDLARVHRAPEQTTLIPARRRARSQRGQRTAVDPGRRPGHRHPAPQRERCSRTRRGPGPLLETLTSASASRHQDSGAASRGMKIRSTPPVRSRPAQGPSRTPRCRRPSRGSRPRRRGTDRTSMGYRVVGGVSRRSCCPDPRPAGRAGRDVRRSRPSCSPPVHDHVVGESTRDDHARQQQ